MRGKARQALMDVQGFNQCRLLSKPCHFCGALMTGRQLTCVDVKEIQDKYRQRAIALEKTRRFTIRNLAVDYGVHRNTILRHVAYMREEVDGTESGGDE